MDTEENASLMPHSLAASIRDKNVLSAQGEHLTALAAF